MRKIVFLSVFLFLSFWGSKLHAQWNKPMKAISKGRAPREAKYNLGLKVGGLWNTFAYSNGEFDQSGKLGLIGGISFERSQTPSFTYGLDVLYGMRGANLNYTADVPFGILEYHSISRDYAITMHTLEIRIPFTYYQRLTRNKIKPYVYLAPDLFYVMGGDIEWDRQDLTTGETLNDESIKIGDADMKRINYGIVGGIGVWFRCKTANSFFFLKLDISYNYSFNNNFSDKEMSGDLSEYYGVNAFDFERLGTRKNRDFELSASIVFPIKKHLQGACINWGKY